VGKNNSNVARIDSGNMNFGLTIYQEFLSAKGHKTLIDGDQLWFNVRPFIYQAVRVQKQKPNTDRLFKEKISLACRWLEPENNTEFVKGLLTKEFIIYPPYDFDSMTKKSRNQTRRGMERFEIKQVKEYKSEITQLELIYKNNLTRLRIGRTNLSRARLWRKWLQVFNNVKEIEIWGAYNNSKLASFLVLVPKYDGFEIVLHRSHTDYLPVYPNNPLLFTVVATKFSLGAAWISYGLQKWGLYQGDGLDHFKLGMGFQEKIYLNHYLPNPYLSHLIPGSIFNSAIRIFQKIA
jgi:hypothetical protein